MKRALKIIAVLLGVILLFAATLFVINIVNLSIMNDYVDTFPAVEIDNKLEPQYDKDGIPYFTTDGDFRVMQLTDLHIGGGILSHNEDKLALNAVAAMISEEKPDLVIITGDISFAVPYISMTFNNRLGHSLVIRLMERLGVYWTVTFGNHDAETFNYHNREKTASFYLGEKLSYCLMDDDGELSGVGNHVINVKNSDGLITKSFYMMDSHAYTENDPLGLKWDYDYVKQDQIEWYRDSVLKFKAQNAEVYASLSDAKKTEHASLLEPESLMFMHIPLAEVKDAYDEYASNGYTDTENVKFITGNVGESEDVVFPSKTDVELFETMLELGSTNALLFGHDHLNNFILEYKGIKFVYGYSIDYLAYDGIDGAGYQRGCLIITCKKDGGTDLKHENYYQDKYKPLYDKEEVDMSKDALK